MWSHVIFGKHTLLNKHFRLRKNTVLPKVVYKRNAVIANAALYSFEGEALLRTTFIQRPMLSHEFHKFYFDNIFIIYYPFF